MGESIVSQEKVVMAQKKNSAAMSRSRRRIRVDMERTIYAVILQRHAQAYVNMFRVRFEEDLDSETVPFEEQFDAVYAGTSTASDE